MEILVANLALTATEEAVRSLFEPLGTVAHVGIVRHPETGRPGGACLVMMPNPGDTQRAIAALNGCLFEGKPIRLSEASPLSVLLSFGLSPEPSEAEQQSGQPPAREAALAMEQNLDQTVKGGKAMAVRHALMLAAGLAVCALFLPGMPLHRRLFPWGVLPILITLLLLVWAFTACIGTLAMSQQRREAQKLVDDLTIGK